MNAGALSAPESDSKANAATNANNTHAPEADSATTHKRSHSGGILARLNFLRSGTEPAQSPTSPTKKSPPLGSGEEEQHVQHSAHANGNGSMEPAMAAAIRQHKARKRKGSLRKTALLTTGRLMFDRRTSVDKQDLREPIKSPPLADGASEYAISTSNGDVVETDFDTTSTATSGSWATLPKPSQLKLDTLTQDAPPPNTQLSPTHHDNQLLSPDSITSPISRYASTTDDDDGGLHLSLGASAADLTRRRSTLRNPVVARAASSPPPHSSADTEYWGWIILFATWIVFVCGMGSCLGVWSWAWDVGETPYAPPELEDDATLPIVGYYPALIVCTGVMAWVWCLVAWVGMKYFRHARFDAGAQDDGD